MAVSGGETAAGRPRMDFFLFYGSTYTYLAVMRVERAAAPAGGAAERADGGVPGAE